jgi:hypothetical protein
LAIDTNEALGTSSDPNDPIGPFGVSRQNDSGTAGGAGSSNTTYAPPPPTYPGKQGPRHLAEPGLAPMIPKRTHLRAAVGSTPSTWSRSQTVHDPFRPPTYRAHPCLRGPLRHAYSSFRRCATATPQSCQKGARQLLCSTVVTKLKIATAALPPPLLLGACNPHRSVDHTSHGHTSSHVLGRNSFTEVVPKQLESYPMGRCSLRGPLRA